ncbi:MAG: FecR domain-containing protein, partial [Dongiaceae bacterium]
MRRAYGRAAAWRFIAILVLILAAVSLGTAPRSDAGTAPPGDQRWLFVETSGRVELSPAGAPDLWQPATVGTWVELGAAVRTGADGSARLSHGGDVIRIGPDSEMSLPAPGQGDDLVTRILQRAGQIFFEVAHRSSGSFRVDTPYLAVVVKGTRFGVSVSGEGTSVSVTEGAISVSKEGGGEAGVSAGETARTGTGPSDGISVSKSSAAA